MGAVPHDENSVEGQNRKSLTSGVDRLAQSKRGFFQGGEASANFKKGKPTTYGRRRYAEEEKRKEGAGRGF